MPRTERFREPVSVLPDQLELERRAAAGWRPVAVEWERTLEPGAAIAVLESTEIPYGLRAEKSGDRLEIGIESDGEHADMPPIDVQVRGAKGEGRQGRVEMRVACELTPEETRALVDVVSSDEFLAPLRDDASEADPIAAMREVLRRHGFASAEVSATDGQVSVTITAPPT